jgi:hypothetical protein
MSLFDGMWAWLFPMPDASESKQIFRWRQVVSLAILLLGASLVVGDALAWGFVPVLYGGFAQQTLVQTMTTSLTEVRASQVERTIIEARERQCYAQRESNMDALQFATEKLNDSLDAYKRAVGHAFRVPECNELIVAKAK